MQRPRRSSATNGLPAVQQMLLVRRHGAPPVQRIDAPPSAAVLRL